MDIRLPHLKESRHLDNESNDSGLSSETSQNSKEKILSVYDSRNLTSMRAVHFALDNHRRMTTLKSQASSMKDSRSRKSISNSNNEVRLCSSLKSKPILSMSPFLVKINPKSSPCCEYLINDDEPLQLPESNHDELGCDYSPFVDTDEYQVDGDNCEDNDLSLSYQTSLQRSSKRIYSGPQSGFNSNAWSRDEVGASDCKVPGDSRLGRGDCLHLITEILTRSKEVMSAFRLLLSARDTGTKVRSKITEERSYSGLLVVDILHAENLQAPSLSSVGGCLRLLQCTVKIDSECRAETTTEIFGDRIIWDERFVIDIRESLFVSFLLFQTFEGCNKRLSYYGGVNLIELLSDFDNDSRSYDQIIVQLEPRGLLYLQLAIVPLCLSLCRGLCCAQDNEAAMATQARMNLSDWIYLIRWCIGILDEKQRLMTSHLYKITSSDRKVNGLMKHVMNSRFHGARQTDDSTTYVVTSLLIMSLREMPEPLIPLHFWEKIHEVIENCFNFYDPIGQYMASEVLIVLKTLPSQNQVALFELLQHLSSVVQSNSQNNTNCHYLATLFAPLLLYDDICDEINLAKFPDNCHVEIIKNLIDNWYGLQDSQRLAIVSQTGTERYIRKSMVSVAIQTEGDKNKGSNLSSLERHDSGNKTVYKSILKKPNQRLSNSNDKSDDDQDRTTFI